MCMHTYKVQYLSPRHYQFWWISGKTYFFSFLKICIVIQLQLYAFSPHPSTPPQLKPPPSPTSTSPLILSMCPHTFSIKQNDDMICHLSDTLLFFLKHSLYQMFVLCNLLFLRNVVLPEPLWIQGHLTLSSVMGPTGGEQFGSGLGHLRTYCTTQARSWVVVICYTVGLRAAAPSESVLHTGS